MAKYITEVLKEINQDVSLFETTYKKYGDGGPLAVLFKHAFIPEHAFILPEGQPPFTPSKEPIGMTPSNMLSEIRRFYVLVRRDLPATKREMVYVQMLESIHPEEAKILQAVKEQTLTKLYPNITRKVVADAGFIPPITEEQAKAEVAELKKGERPSGRSSKPKAPKTAE
jgi:hypothetical protein